VKIIRLHTIEEVVMRITLLTSSALLLSALLPLSFVSPVTVQAAELVSKKAQPQSSTAKPNGNGVAPSDQAKDAGAEKVVEDKLKTCLSRIPKDSSTGQRLLAEQGCRKEQEVRSARHAAPEF
jgi:hypothetical protein